jgi:hypothetical protein
VCSADESRHRIGSLQQTPPARALVTPDPLVTHVLDVAEGFADGVASRADFLAARKRVRQAEKDKHPYAGLLGRYGGVTDDAMEGISVAVEKARRKYPTGGKAVECGLIRCIFGNPHRPTAFAPKWLTPKVVALAGGIDAERAFDRMPVLADALEEAGCAEAEILQHCRGTDPHARGCWVVDPLLKKG